MNCQLLIATRNQGKMREYRHLLQGIPFELASLDDLGVPGEVEETGATFPENAWLKAAGYCKLAGVLTLSDDSGLEVAALNGDPGVRSARYGGDACRSDPDRVALLLRNLQGVPWAKRMARFRCVIAVAAPEIPPNPPFAKGGTEGFSIRRAVQVVGSVAGMIQYEPAGDEGFGYDPVFYLPSYGLTMAQLPLAEKNNVSHRADAARKAVAALRNLQA